MIDVSNELHLMEQELRLEVLAKSEAALDRSSAEGRSLLGTSVPGVTMMSEGRQQGLSED